MKHLRKMSSVIIAVFVLVLCLASCSTMADTDNLVEESAVLEKYPMTLRALVKVIDSQRAENLKDNDYYKTFKDEYEAKYHNYYSSITPKEAVELVTIRERKESVTYKQAVDDVDLFFRMLRYRLGRYEFLGGDEVFFKARDAVMNKLSAYKNKKVKTSDLASMIVSELTFIDDTHFRVDNISPFYDFNADKKLYLTYLSGLTFKADNDGYYINEKGEKFYFVSCDDDNASVVPMLNNYGELVYSLVLYCTPAEVPFLSTATFKGNNEITKIINWEKTSGTRVSNGLVYSETDKMAYIGLTACGNEVENKLEEIGRKARKKDVVILDLRRNGGTHADEFFKGYIEFPLTIDEVVMIRVGLTNSNRIKPGEEYTKFLQFSKEWKIWKAKPFTIVLVDNNTGCAPEEFARYFRYISNSVVIGTNTKGHLDGGTSTSGDWDRSKYDTVYLHLPNTGMEVCASTSISLYGDYESFVGKGFKPDIYVADTSRSLDYVLKLLVNEGYITVNDAKLYSSAEFEEHVLSEVYVDEEPDSFDSSPKHEHTFERNLSKGGLYYLDTCVECGYREVYVDEGLASRCAPFFGLDSNISYIDNPKTLEDYDNNILYSALIGDYTPTIHFNTKDELKSFIDEMFKEDFFHSKRDGRWFSRYHALVGTYGALLGYATNQRQDYVITSSKNGGYDLTVTITCFDTNHYPDGIPSEKDFFLQQLVALEQAKSIHDALHGPGYAGMHIGETTSDLEKVKMYTTFILTGKGLVSPEYGRVKKDGIFAGLNLLASNSAGTEALVTVFLHLENMKAQTYIVEGHVITRFEADGSILFYDYSSKNRFFSSEEDYTKKTGTRGIEYGEGCWLLF